MSEYKTCRICGTNLMWNGRSFGARECCCNNGYCTACCQEEEDRQPTTPGSGGEGWER